MSKPSITTSEFIKLAADKHDSKYVYTIGTESVKAHQKITIDCPVHGSFEQKSFHHLSGAGCKDCGIAARSGFKNKEWLDKSQKVSSFLKIPFRWIDCNNIELHCEVHGTRIYSYYRTLKAKGCPSCYRETKINHKKKNLDDYSCKLEALYSGKYRYSEKSFGGLHKPIEIICEEHGLYKIPTLLSHLRGSECPRCTPRSKVESAWLDEQNIHSSQRNILLIIDQKKYYVDGYDPITNTVYEFWGDYYHGNPDKFPPNSVNPTCQKTFAELYQKTLDKINAIKSAGYNLIEVWESDYRNTATFISDRG